jgi:2-polyprenyl-3-methyl-5-hydroxy-6-metoxy-1,4-benzoquinol methylase
MGNMAIPTKGSQEAATAESCRYDCEIDVNSDSTHAKVVRLVGTDKRVLELGCATGYMSRVFRDRECQVVAVEIDPKAAERASAFCERVIVGDLDQIDLAQELGEDRFDVVVAADVLEHLKDPLSTLLTVKGYLRPDGYIVASIPNVAHGSVRLALLGGQFPYSELGLLDRTHLRFYTRETMEKLFEDAGFVITHFERQEQKIDASEVLYDKTAIPVSLLEALSQDPKALTYQFIVVVYPIPRATLGLIQHRIRELTEEKEAAWRETAELRQAVKKQTEQLDSLAARVELMSSREEDLRTMLLDAHDQLLWRDEEIRAALHDLQDTLAALQQNTSNTRTVDQSVVPSKRLGYQEYQQLIDRIREVVRSTLPPDTTVVVVSKGDNELLKLEGRRAWHFPQREDGVYAGYYPADSAAAIAHLEALRAKGGQFLLFPQTAFWWLEHYAEFKQHLESHYRVVVRQEDTCLIFALRELETERRQPIDQSENLRYQQLIRQIREVVRSILPLDATVVVVSKGDNELLKLEGRKAWHFPQTDDGTYAGHYPANSAAAIAHLEALRARGGEFLLFPSTAFWWLEYYREFKQHLERQYRLVVRQKYVCLIFALRENRVRQGVVKGQAKQLQSADTMLTSS